MFSDSGSRLAAVAALEAGLDDSDAEILAGCVMPDHVHLLFTLGPRLRIGQIHAKAKMLLRRPLPGPIIWQEDAFEHRLRPKEESEDYAFYCFMNPYQAGLVTAESPWPGWWTRHPERLRFLGLARPGRCPQPEWITLLPEVASRIVAGE